MGTFSFPGQRPAAFDAGGDVLHDERLPAAGRLPRGPRAGLPEALGAGVPPIGLGTMMVMG